MKRRVVEGKLAVEFAPNPDGRTFIRRQYSSYPFHICRPHYHDSALPGLATLYLQSCAGGIYEDDRLMIDVLAAPLAEAHVTSQASTIVHGMSGGHAEHEVRITVHDGAYIEYLPDPLILFPQSSMESTLMVSLVGSGCAVISESFLTHDPTAAAGLFSTFRSEIIIEDEVGKRLAIDRIHFDRQPSWARWTGIIGHFGAQGTIVIAGKSLVLSPLEIRLKSIDFEYSRAALGVSRLPHSAGLIVRILADDGASLKLAMYQAWCALRFVLKGDVPCPRRK